MQPGKLVQLGAKMTDHSPSNRWFECPRIGRICGYVTSIDIKSFVDLGVY
jgi:hypothetical protein